MTRVVILACLLTTIEYKNIWIVMKFLKLLKLFVLKDDLLKLSIYRSKWVTKLNTLKLNILYYI